MLIKLQVYIFNRGAGASEANLLKYALVSQKRIKKPVLVLPAEDIKYEQKSLQQQKIVHMNTINV